MLGFRLHDKVLGADMRKDCVLIDVAIRECDVRHGHSVDNVEYRIDYRRSHIIEVRIIYRSTYPWSSVMENLLKRQTDTDRQIEQIVSHF